MKATRKLAFTLILAFVALVATLSVTPEPAHAIYCSNNFLGCYYSYVELTAGGHYCCMYRCSDGRTIRGVCGHA